MTSVSQAAWRRWLARVTPGDRRELFVLLGALFGLLLVVAFFLLAAEVVEGDTQAFDLRVLRALRSADDPSIPIGPPWLRGAALDITSLGSATVLSLTTLAICGFLLLQRMARTALFVFVATAGGWALNALLKEVFQRARPKRGAAPAGRDVAQLSERPRDDLRSGLPDAWRAHDARGRVAADQDLLHGHRHAGDLPGRREPGLPGRPLSH